MSPQSKPKVVIEYQTFQKSDLEDAINYECFKWGELHRAFPHKVQSDPPFDVRDAYWPEIERSQEMRAKLEEQLLPFRSRQNASQFHMYGDKYHSKYEDEIMDADERRIRDIERINKEHYRTIEDSIRSQWDLKEKYGETLQELVDSKALLGSNLDELSVLGVDVGKLSTRQTVPTFFRKKKDVIEQIGEDTSQDDGWIIQYCLPYLGLSLFLYAVAHVLGIS